MERGELVLRRERWHACTDRYPAGDVNIRSASDAAYRIALSDDPDRIIGTVESSTAFKTLHPGAIYLHLGETFLVERLDTEERTAYVRPAEAAYYTEASESSHILILATNRRRVLGCTELPLLIGNESSPLPVLDSTRLLARAALRKATEGCPKP